jgi:hypothetical protein
MAKQKKQGSTIDRIKSALGLKQPGPKDFDQNLPTIGFGSKLPDVQAPSRLKNETRGMENARRDLEQQGHRRHLQIRVHARERLNDEPLSLEQSVELEAASSLMQNPLLDSQRFDGYDPNVNPSTIDNPDARREFDNERRKQEQEKQLRLGLSPNNAKKFKPKFTPSGY